MVIISQIREGDIRLPKENQEPPKDGDYNIRTTQSLVSTERTNSLKQCGIPAGP